MTRRKQVDQKALDDAAVPNARRSMTERLGARPMLTAGPIASSSAPIATDPRPNISDRLRGRYGFRDNDAVERFIGRHPELLPLLVDARRVIDTYFGQRTPVELEVFIDPEAPNETTLFVLIQTRLSTDEALRSLRSFDEEWWVHAIDRADGHLVISFEHVERCSIGRLTSILPRRSRSKPETKRRSAPRSAGRTMPSFTRRATSSIAGSPRWCEAVRPTPRFNSASARSIGFLAKTLGACTGGARTRITTIGARFSSRLRPRQPSTSPAR